ncbi:hypothetical protein D9M68_649380 [compost metagenome]
MLEAFAQGFAVAEGEGVPGVLAFADGAEIDAFPGHAGLVAGGIDGFLAAGFAQAMGEAVAGLGEQGQGAAQGFAVGVQPGFQQLAGIGQGAGLPVAGRGEQAAVTGDAGRGRQVEQQVAQPEGRQLPFAEAVQAPAEQTFRGDAVQPAVDAHAGQFDIHQQRLRHGLGARLEQAWSEGPHRAAQLAPEGVAQFADGQPAGSAGDASLVGLGPAAFHRIQRQLAQAAPGRAFEAEGLIAGEGFLGFRQAQAEALFEEEARRMAEALDQLRGLEGQPVGVRLRQGQGEGRGSRLGRFRQALGRTEPGRGEAGLLVACEVGRGEGLQRMGHQHALAGLAIGSRGGEVDGFQQFADQH